MPSSRQGCGINYRASKRVDGSGEGAMSEHVRGEDEEASLRERRESKYVETQYEDTIGQAVSECATCEDDGALALEAWLRELDAGRDTLLQFLEPLKREFGDLAQLAASVLPDPAGASVVDNIDPLVFEVLGARSLGHKLLLAKGICKLEQGR